MYKVIFTVFLCFSINACIGMVPYRTELNLSNPCIGKHSYDCPKDAFFLKQTKETLGYNIHTGIIEFDDQGTLLRRQFKNKMLDKIHSTGKEEDVLMVIYAHGWKHNADPHDENLRGFQDMLVNLAKIDQEACHERSCENRKVIGVYLAWRGLSATIEPFKTLSFWNRKSRAHRVGQDGATEVLAELAKIKAQRENNRLIFVGHSFGGALIYSATQQILMKSTAFLNRDSVPRSIANLIILINPAFEAARFTAFKEKGASLTYKNTQRPILAIFTSATDEATKIFFKKGREFSTAFSKYNPEKPEQKERNITAIGHYSGYLTHTLKLKSRENETTLVPLSNAVCNWEKYQQGKSDNWDLVTVSLARMGTIKIDGQRNTPFYNVEVDDAILSGHEMTWSGEFMNFLYKFVAVQDAKPCYMYNNKEL